MATQDVRSPAPLSREEARSAALHRYQILDTPREAEFDDIATLAAEVCQTPIAVVNFIDTGRQFFKAEVGLGVRETPLETSFCGMALLTEEMMVVPDATRDPRFEGNPLVTEGGLRFYAGALLKTRDGFPIGTLCVLDRQPRQLDEHQIRTLHLLARQTMTQIELRAALADTRRTEARHRQVLDSSIDYAIISLDLNGDVTGWNRGAENVLGWTEAEMLGRPAAIIFNELDRLAGVPEQEMEAARIHGRGTDERWHLRRDGSRFFALGELMPLRDDANRHVGYVKILRDRTGARRQAQRLALLSQVSGALMTGDDPAATLRPILEGGADTIGFDQCYLYDVAPGDRRLILRHSVGASEAVRTTLRDVSFDIPLCGIVAETAEPLILSDLRAEAEPRHEIGRSVGLQAYAGFPICVHGKLLGVISFGSLDQARFDEETLDFFRAVVGLLAVARERADDAQALRDAEQRLRLAQEAGKIGTFELDLARNEITPSAEFCRIFGITEAETLPADLLDTLVLDHDAGLISGRAGREETAGDVDYRIRRASDGRMRWITRRSDHVRDASGQVRLMRGTVQDVTERKAAALRQEALLRLGNGLRHATDPDEMARIACDTLFEALDVTRASFARADHRASLFRIVGERIAADAPAMQGSYSFADFLRTTAQLTSGEPLIVRNAAAEAEMAADVDGYRAIGVMAQISIPLMLKGTLVGALFVHQDHPRDWTAGEIGFVRRAADRLYAALAAAQAEAEQAVLNHELSHRLKNSLSMVQAIASQTLRGSTDRAALKDFLRRIQALSEAHDVLLHRNWEAGAIEDTIRSTIATFAERERVTVDGPLIELGPKSTLTLSMLLHELATNAVKYGALSDERGIVAIRWQLEAVTADDRDLVITWQETGGPPVAPPAGRGFGTRLIQLGLTGTGGVETRFDPLGVAVTIRAPFSHVQHS